MKRTLKLFLMAVIACSMFTMAILTIAAERTGNQGLTLITLPGLWCGLFIAGGHGGNSFQEMSAQLVAVTVNSCVVGIPLICLFFVIPKSLRNRTSK